MFKSIRMKWGLMLVGSSLLALQFGQCVGDFIEDALVFTFVN